MARCAHLALAFALLALAAARAGADIDGKTFTRAQWGQRLTLTGPKNWEMSEERSYPSVWLWMVRRDPPGKMLLSAERLEAGGDSLAYARRTAALLEPLGFTVRPPQLHSQTGAYWIDFDNGEVYLRQALLVVGEVGYALTLAADSSRHRGAHLRAFDAALRSIKVKKIKPSNKSPAAGDDDAAAADDAGPP